MKCLLISTFDTNGGAACSAFRLLKGLQANGVDAKMLVQFKSGDDQDVIAPVANLEKGISLLRPTLDSLPLKYYRKREYTIFSPAVLPDNLATRVTSLKPDLIHLHWVAGGFLRIESLCKFRKPIFWTLHDMWAFTGGCHYDISCGKYKDVCGACPQLNSKRQNDLSHRVLKRKKKAWRDLNITLITPSRWLAECARSSSLFRNKPVKVIPYGLDIEQYKPFNKNLVRDMLKLPQDKKLILFGAIKAASDKRKGFQFLEPALKKLIENKWVDKFELVVFGTSKPVNPPDFGLKVNYLGHIHDDISLAMIYSAADVFVLPSIQDNLPNTIIESLACGTPVVAFDVGGVPDMVEHQKNGYLVKLMDTDDMARGIHWVLEKDERAVKLGQAGREKAVREYSLEMQAKRYCDLYEDVINRQAGRYN